MLGGVRKRDGLRAGRKLFLGLEQLLAQPDIDGGLVGGASLKADQFVQLVKACL